MRIWEAGEGCENTVDFKIAIENSDLEELQFSDDVLIDLWGVVTDARANRI